VIAFAGRRAVSSASASCNGSSSGRGDLTEKQALPTLRIDEPSGVGSSTGISSTIAAAAPGRTVT
jgi:hypothetical protein